MQRHPPKPGTRRPMHETWKLKTESRTPGPAKSCKQRSHLEGNFRLNPRPEFQNPNPRPGFRTPDPETLIAHTHPLSLPPFLTPALSHTLSLSLPNTGAHRVDTFQNPNPETLNPEPRARNPESENGPEKPQNGAEKGPGKSEESRKQARIGSTLNGAPTSFFTTQSLLLSLHLYYSVVSAMAATSAKAPVFAVSCPQKHPCLLWWTHSRNPDPESRRGSGRR